jgi:serine/threonine-protein kinase
VLLYQLLAGKNPFKGAEPPETVARVLTHVAAPVSTLCPGVPIGVEAAIAKALSKEPAERFDSVADFARALREACVWSEREAAESFAAQVVADFNGPMAEKLGLESLAVREASWRDAQDVTPGRRVSLSSSPPGIVSGVVAQPAASTDDATRRDTSDVPTARVGRARMEQLAAQAKTSMPSPPPPAPRRPWIWLVLAALAAGAGSAAVLLLVPGRESAKAAGVVVIEKQNDEPAAEAAEPAPPVADVAPSAAPVEPEPAATASAPSAKAAPRVAAPGGGGGAPLAQAFQRQGGKIQRCFEQNPGAVQGISVRFQIDAAGKVQNAVVSPASVAGSPLGACIAGVARATSFGPQPEPVAFSIPIAARVVKR